MDDFRNTEDDDIKGPNVAYPPPAVDEVQRVDAEPMGDNPRSGGDTPHIGPRIHVFTAQSGAALSMLKPPVISTWICLAVAWLFLGSKIPFTVFIGIPFDLAALFLALMCLSRGGMFTGLSVLLLGTVGSLVVYLIGIFRFLTIG
jgi:hypothetical protein